MRTCNRHPYLKVRLLVLLLSLTTGCTMYSSYRPADGIAPRETEELADSNRAIPVFGWPNTAPAIYERIGSLKIRDTGFSMLGGSKNAVLEQALEIARTRGGDAISIRKWYPPDSGFTTWRLDADVLRVRSEVDKWPKFAIDGLSERHPEAFASDRESDLIGIWEAQDGRFEIAIVHASATDEYELHGLVLRSQQPFWEPGHLKLGLRRTATAGVYRLDYFDSQFRRCGATLPLRTPGLLDLGVQDSAGRGLPLLVKTFPQISGERNTERAPATVSTGTGFAVSSGGLILTAEHVIHGATSITAQFSDGRQARAEVVAATPSNDLALLRVPIADLTPLPISRSTEAQLGERVFTVGYPVLGVLGQDPKFTDGSISSFSGLGGEQSTMQVTVPIQPGNSGGPLLREDGSVIGVITSSAAVQGFLEFTGTLPQSINWAIKSEYALLLSGELQASPSALTRDRAIQRTIQAICIIEAR